jgi:hypothetical protein
VGCAHSSPSERAEFLRRDAALAFSHHLLLVQVRGEAHCAIRAFHVDEAYPVPGIVAFLPHFLLLDALLLGTAGRRTVAACLLKLA